MESRIKTFAFFDIETTGLPELEYYKTKITELSIVACTVDHFMDPKVNLPRVQPKLTMCFNPMKRIDLKSSEITGLTNELLEHEKKFDKNAMNVLESFLFHLQQPVCLIAHNGKKFDFPLLKKQFDRLNGSFPFSIKCCDSLEVFKTINEQMELKEKLLRESYSLQEWCELTKQDGVLIKTLIEPDSSSDSQTDKNGIDEAFKELIDKELEDIEKEEIKIEQTTNNSIFEDFKSFQKINETSPTASTKQLNLKPTAQQSSQAPLKRTILSRRELFPTASMTTPEKYARKSFSLREIHNRFFNRYPENSHDAESDVIALMKCAAECKEDFIKLVNETCFNFVDIKEF